MDEKTACENFEALFHFFAKKALVVIDNSERCRDENTRLRAVLVWAFCQVPGAGYRIIGDNKYDDDGGQIGETTYRWQKIGWENRASSIINLAEPSYRVTIREMGGYPDKASAILAAFLDHGAHS